MMGHRDSNKINKYLLFFKAMYYTCTCMLRALCPLSDAVDFVDNGNLFLLVVFLCFCRVGRVCYWVPDW